MIQHRERAQARRAGFSLLELSFATGLMAIVLGASWRMQVGGREAFAEASRTTAIGNRAQMALERAVGELALVGADQLFPTPGADFALGEFFYRRVLGMQEGELQWSALQRLGFELEPGEVDDGLDNDGDGFVDEGRLVLVRGFGEPEETRVVLCSGVSELLEGELDNGEDDNGNGLVDEPGFHLVADDQLLTLRLTLLDRSPRGVGRFSIETSLGTRN